VDRNGTRRQPAPAALTNTSPRFIYVRDTTRRPKRPGPARSGWIFITTNEKGEWPKSDILFSEPGQRRVIVLEYKVRKKRPKSDSKNHSPHCPNMVIVAH
jgi:hypothetical protein